MQLAHGGAKTGMPKMTAAKQGIVDTESFKATGTLIAKGIDKSHDAVKATEKYVLDTGIELSKKVFNTLVWWVKKAAESQKAAREETFR